MLEGASNSNGLGFGVSGTANDRKSWIQSGHPDQQYASSLGTLAINPLGGNVGIGTTSPLAKLHAKSGDSGVSSVDTGTSAIIESDTTNYLRFLNPDSANAGLVWTSPSDNFAAYLRWKYSSRVLEMATAKTNSSISFSTGNADERMRITSAGNVGIGTTSPGSRLTVSGTNNATSEITLINTNPSTDNDWSITPFYNDQTLRFRTNSAATTVMTLKDNGNVGIGTTSPSQKLTVVGNTYISSGLLLLDNNQDIRWGDAGERITGNNTNGLVFTTNNLEAMRINSAGNVGIGTTSPVTNLQIASTGTPTLPNASGTALSTGSRLRLSSVGGPSATLDIGIGTGGKSWLQSRDVTDLSINYPFLINPNGGNVGIGTTSPSKKLTVYGGNDNGIWVDSSGSQYTSIAWGNNGTEKANIAYDNTNANFVLSAYGASNTVFSNNGSEGMRIDSAGNVGIGTTSPSTKLEVTGHVTINSPAGASQTSYGLRLRKTNSSSAVQAGGEILASVYPPNTNAANLIFKTANASANLTQRMVIDGIGNVGIGTTSPSAGRKLDVHGDIELTEDLFIGATGSSRSEHKIKIGQNRSGNGYAYIDMIGDAAATSFYNLRIIRHNSGANALSQIIHTGTGNFEIKASDGGDIILNSSGSIGISQTSPSYKLDVTGDGRFTSTVTAANFILSSDERLKENVEKVCDNKVEADWKTFELKTEKGQKRYGVIAQELEKTNPEFVREDSQGFKSVAYIDLLIAKIAELEARLEKLEK
jgi:hypothetical protein